VKKIAVVPTLLTLGNGICGFVAIAVASKINLKDTPEPSDWLFALAGWFIMAAMVFDMLDGYVARLSRTASKFGGELDSLNDAISFGVAPAFLLLKMGPGWEPRPILHQILAGVAAVYVSCVLLRLARFNVDNTPDPASHKKFRGLPSPAAAGCVGSLAIMRGGFSDRLAQIWNTMDAESAQRFIVQLVEMLSPVVALVVALLMVSNVPYPHLTKQIFRGRRHVGHLIQVLLGVLIIIVTRELALFLIFWIYALALPVRYFLQKNFRHEAMPAPDPIPR
jgi:CDP-diacylglycerol---serine O-phosphatidyltransferase